MRPAFHRTSLRQPSYQLIGTIFSTTSRHVKIEIFGASWMIRVSSSAISSALRTVPSSFLVASSMARNSTSSCGIFQKKPSALTTSTSCRFPLGRLQRTSKRARPLFLVQATLRMQCGRAWPSRASFHRSRTMGVCSSMAAWRTMCRSMLRGKWVPTSLSWSGFPNS